MKKLIIFLSVCLLLLIVSCGKESPTWSETPETPASSYCLTIISDPSEAEIWINDQSTGAITTGTACGISLGLKHKVTLKKAGFMNFNWDIVMKATGLTYDVDLAPGEGEFWPEPVEDASIEVNGDLNITTDYAGDWHCTGELKNLGGRWADWIRINFFFYDKEDNIIDTDFSYCEGRCGSGNTGLKPAQRGFFRIWTNVSFDKVAKYEYDITWITRGY